MESFGQIQELISLLSQSTIKDYHTILSHFDFKTINFEPFETWSQQKYTRNCLFCDDDFELILICWEQEQETAIHCHDGKDCWVYLLEGGMQEVFFKMDKKEAIREVRSRNIVPNQLTFMNDTIGFHKLKNSYKGKSISLHLYAKPIKNCKSFDEISQQFVERKLSYDTFKQFQLIDKF